MSGFSGYVIGWLLGAITIGGFTASHFKNIIVKEKKYLNDNVIYKCEALEEIKK